MPGQSESFDVIVIGAGSAGCILAGRLASVQGLRVLMLEAGGAAFDPWLTIPGGYYRMLQSKIVDWQYIGLPEQGLGGRQIHHRSGKVLGGSSAINGMVYIRGAVSDYDRWATDLDDPAWTYENLLPLFRRSEDNRDFHDRYHGTGGPIVVARPHYKSDVTEAFIDSAVQVGLPPNGDFNGSSMDGVGYYQLTAHELRRSSSADFVRETGPNLEVRLNQHVSRILFEGRKAVGVEIVHPDGSLTRISCDGEIVLCAGAIGTPTILQRSGIGPTSLLESLGIPIVMDNPEVGANLQDHLQVKVMFETDSKHSLNGLQRKVLEDTERADGHSELLGVGAGVAGLFARSGHVVAPDIQFHIMPFSEETPGRLHSVGGITASVCALRPQSRGAVNISAADPFAKPRIRCSYLAVAQDVIPLREGLRLLGRICEKIPQIKSSLSEISLQDSDDALDDYVRRMSYSIFHPVGTCAMGKPRGVVDSRLAVRGIEGLRIADASVMPAIVSGNTNAASIMLGERGADMVSDSLGLTR